MDKIIIKSVVKQPDEKYKINFTATFPDDSHFEGFVFIDESTFETANVASMRQTVADKFNAHLGGDN